MSIINAIVQFVMDLGGGVFLPFTILILGIIFKQKPFDALRNGLRVGAGFLGINVILNMLISGLQPAIDYYAQYGDGAGFTIVDIGWEGLPQCMVHIVCSFDCAVGNDSELCPD